MVKKIVNGIAVNGIFKNINGVISKNNSLMVKKSLAAQPLTVNYSIIGVYGKKILLTANFFSKTVNPFC